MCDMKKILYLFCSFTFASAYAQTELVFVFFKDKPNAAAFYANPLTELTQKALDRRTNLGIALNDQDAPIEPTYIQNVRNLGFTVTDYSKWLNGVAVNATAEQIILLESQSYVQNVESFVKNPSGGKGPHQNEFEKIEAKLSNEANFDYGSATAQMEQINLIALHQQGFTGEGITIALLDNGYQKVDTGSTFARLRDHNKIKGGYNFVLKNSNLYQIGALNYHGTYCLGTIGGYVEGSYAGSAPDAEYYLYVTETRTEEIPEEELYWIEGAEDADRKGVDIISSSLAYSTFDDSRYNYTYSDMTGTRSFIARGAQIAAEKGILIFEAAGNSGDSTWHYILTPGDNEKVFTVGAVTADGTSSDFSSYGPNYLGIIKPDASALGSNTVLVYNDNIIQSSGTSFSTPLAAGGTASLLQALPKTTSRELIKNTLRQNASLYPSNTAQMGYGILNFGDAYTQLSETLTASEIDKELTVSIYPNPNSGQFTLQAKSEGNIRIYDTNGRLLYSGKVNKGNNQMNINLSSGLYILVLDAQGRKVSEKIIVK